MTRTRSELRRNVLEQASGNQQGYRLEFANLNYYVRIARKADEGAGAGGFYEWMFPQTSYAAGAHVSQAAPRHCFSALRRGCPVGGAGVPAPAPTLTAPTAPTALPPRRYKQLLHDMSGRFESGKLTGIMGASGTGKTTLLNLISGRAKSGEFSGLRMINGQPLEPLLYKSVLAAQGYVIQQDCFLEDLTVQQCLTFEARLLHTCSPICLAQGTTAACAVCALHCVRRPPCTLPARCFHTEHPSHQPPHPTPPRRRLA